MDPVLALMGTLYQQLTDAQQALAAANRRIEELEAAGSAKK